MSFKRTETAVGAFILMGTALTLGIIFKLDDVKGWLGGQESYYALYNNVGTIQEGSIVKFLGMRVGRVDTVRIDEEHDNLIRVDFSITVDEAVRITDRMEAKITRSDLLGDEYVNLQNLGVPAGSTEALRHTGRTLNPGEEVEGGDPFDLQSTLEEAGYLIGSLHRLLGDIEVRLEDATDQLGVILADVGDLLSDENKGNVNSAIANISGAAADLRAAVGENRERIDSIFSNVDSASGRLETTMVDVKDTVAELRPDLEQLAGKLKSAVEQLDDVLDQAATKLDTLDAEQVNEVIENLDASSRNLNELTHELKQRPYRLIRKEKQPPKEFR